MSTNDWSSPGNGAAAPHSDFLNLAAAWRKDQSNILLGFVWKGYDRMKKDAPAVDGRDLERSITQLLAPRIHQTMSGDEPFYIQHGPFERETMQAPPAQPLQYDMAFVLKSDERIMWPMEAKVLETSGSVSEYVEGVRDQFLTCRYAPFVADGARLGYLLSGAAADAFRNIEVKLFCTLEDNPVFPSRTQKLSHHNRKVPSGKPYHSVFRCHHLILDYPGLKRSRS